MKRILQVRQPSLRIELVTTTIAFLMVSVLAADESSISFKRDVAPIFLENCVACHDAKKAEGGYRIDTFTELSKSGDSGVLPLKVSNDEGAELLRRLTVDDAFERMPAEAEALTADQIKVVSEWIGQGAIFDGDDPDTRLPFVIPPKEHPASPTIYPAPLQVTAIAFSTGRDLVFSGGYNEILVWDTQGNLQERIGNVGQQTYAIAFPPISSIGQRTDLGNGDSGAPQGPADRQVVVASGRPGFAGDVRVIDLVSKKVTAVLAACDDVVLDLAFRPDGKKLAVASADKTIRIIDMETLKVQQTLLSHADFVNAIAWSKDGTKLVSASRDKSAKVFNAETGQLLISYQGHGNAVRGVFMLPDGKQVVSAGNDKKVHRWNISDAKKTAEVAIGGEGYRIAVAGDLAFVPSSDNKLVKVDLTKNQVATEFKGHADWVLCSAVHSDHTKVATGSHDGEIRVWNLADGTLVSSWLAQPTGAEEVKTSETEADGDKTGDAKTSP
jgi:WD40 repeat protein